jgi:hypothetical protein
MAVPDATTNQRNEMTRRGESLFTERILRFNPTTN